ncbi:MAG: oligosaccharide flippase family protein [Planctomycetota bacterium]
MPNVHRQMQAGFLVMPAAFGAQMLGMLLVASYLGPHEFGVFSVIFAILTVVNFVTEMGMGIIITKLVAEGEKPAGHHIALALPVVLIASLLGAIVQLVIVWVAYPTGDARWAGVVAAVNILIFSTSMVLSCTLRGLGKMGKWMAGFLGQKVIFVLLALAGFTLGHGGLVTAVAAWTVSSTIVALYYLVDLWGGVWRGQLLWRPAEMRSLIRESVPVGLISATNQFGMQLDTFVLAILLSEREVGLYALGQRLLNPARNILHGAVSTPTFPGLCRLATEDREEFSRRASRLCVVQWLAGLPLAVAAWVIAPLLVPRLLSEFRESVPVIWITVWALAPASVTLQLRYVYTALSNQDRFLRLNAIQLLVKTVLLITLTWRWGMLGACYGTVIAEVVFTWLAGYGLKAMGVPLKLMAGIATASVATGGFVVVLWIIGAGRWPVLALTAAYLLVVAVIINRLLREVRHREPGAVADRPSLPGESRES